MIKVLHGFYHVSWAGSPNESVLRSQQRADVVSMANAGFDVAHLSHLQNVSHTKNLLRVAQERGMLLILEDVHPTEQHHFAGHPALLAFSVADDANVKPVSAVQEACRAAHVGAGRYISVGPVGNGHCYGLSELIGVQVYPFPTENLAAYWPLLVENRTQADRAGQRLFLNAQAHPNPAPTPAQVRAQAWMAAAAGVDGLLWYAWLDQGGRIAPDVLAAVRAVTLEVRGRVSGRPAGVSLVGDVLSASWPGGVNVSIDLASSQIVD